MDFYTAIGLDLLAAGILLYCIWAAAKKGFLRTVIQMVAYLCILLVSSYLSTAAAPVIYDRVVEPMLFEQSERLLHGDQPMQEESGPGAGAALVSFTLPGGLDAAGDALAGMLDSLTGSLGELDTGDAFDSFTDSLEGLDGGALADELLEGALGATDELIGEIADATIRPMMIGAIRMIGFVLLFALLSMVANCLLAALGVVRYLPVISTINRLLGGVVGAAQGVLIVWILGILLQGILYLYPEGWWLINEHVLAQSHLFSLLFSYSNST